MNAREVRSPVAHNVRAIAGGNRDRAQADRNAAIVQRVTSGMSRRVVADELGLTRQRVSQIVIRATGADHQPRHDPWPEERGQRLRAMWDEGLSVNEIARRLGVSRGSVVGKVRRLDLPARPSPIRPKSGRHG
jgi:DNA-binding transcriptional regulator LsrR (DeoR family)